MRTRVRDLGGEGRRQENQRERGKKQDQRQGGQGAGTFGGVREFLPYQQTPQAAEQSRCQNDQDAGIGTEQRLGITPRAGGGGCGARRHEERNRTGRPHHAAQKREQVVLLRLPEVLEYLDRLAANGQVHEKEVVGEGGGEEAACEHEGGRV